MQNLPRAPSALIKEINKCFFEINGMCQHIKSEFNKCPDEKCELFKPHNQIKKNQFF